MVVRKNSILVIAECTADGVKSVSLEVLTAARKLASAMEKQVVALVLGQENGAAEAALKEYGVDEICSVAGAEFVPASADAYVYAVSEIIKSYTPEVVMAGSTTLMKEVMPRIGARFDAGVVSGCVDCVYDEENQRIVWKKTSFGGSYVSTVFCKGMTIALIEAGSFEQRAQQKEAELVRANIIVPFDAQYTTIAEILKNNSSQEDVTTADVIVAGGCGVGSAEGFECIKALADELGGVAGASRAAVDNGWALYSQQVGQSGKTVKPKLYIACGISGAVQHIAGMRNAGLIVAINNDADAPIFKIADYGIVGDLLKVVPALLDEIKKIRA